MKRGTRIVLRVLSACVCVPLFLVSCAGTPEPEPGELPEATPPIHIDEPVESVMDAPLFDVGEPVLEVPETSPFLLQSQTLFEPLLFPPQAPPASQPDMVETVPQPSITVESPERPLQSLATVLESAGLMGRIGTVAVDTRQKIGAEEFEDTERPELAERDDDVTEVDAEAAQDTRPAPSTEAPPSSPPPPTTAPTPAPTPAPTTPPSPHAVLPVDPGDTQSDARPLQEVPGRVGEELSVELPGLGWIYLGSAETNAPELIRRIHHADTTEFVFRIRDEEPHRLRFQRQDLGRGELETQEVVLGGTGDGSTDESGATTAGADAEDAGESRQRSEPELQDAVAAALDQEDSGSREAVLSEMLSQGLIPEADTLRRSADQRAAEGDIGGAIELFEQYLSSFPGGAGRDYAHFQLGRLYEQPGVHRNMRESRRHYGIVMDEFPRSRFYGDARSRVLYQDRHFFELR